MIIKFRSSFGTLFSVAFMIVFVAVIPWFDEMHPETRWGWILWAFSLVISLVCGLFVLQKRLVVDDGGIRQRGLGRSSWHLFWRDIEAWSLGKDRESAIHIWLRSRTEARLFLIDPQFLAGSQYRRIVSILTEHCGRPSELESFAVDHYEYKAIKILLNALLFCAVTLTAFGENQSATNAPISVAAASGGTGVPPVLSGVAPES